MKLEFSDVTEICIHAVGITFAKGAVLTAFRIFHHEHIMAIFAVDHVISSTRLAVKCIDGPSRERETQLLISRARVYEVFVKLTNFTFVRCFVVFFIVDVEFLVSEIDASKAIRASEAVCTQRQIARIVALNTVRAVVQFLAKNTLVTELAFVGIVTITDIPAVRGAVAVERVFIE